MKAVILDENGINRALARISYEIAERNKGIKNICIIGIFTRGKFLANRIAKKLKSIEPGNIPVGYLDITPYRDDSKVPDGYNVKTDINFDIKDKDIILVDDVIYTGRSVRAAIDGIMSAGRPKSIQLAVLIDRGHRELPFRADYIGKNLPTSREEQVAVLLEEADGENKVVIL